MLNVIGEYIISKVIVDRSKIPYELYKQVEPLTREFHDIGNALSKIKTDEPFSWISAVGTLSDRFIEKPNTVDKNEQMEYIFNKGYNARGSHFTEWCEEFIIKNCKATVEKNSDLDYAASITLKDGIKVYFYGDHEKDKKSQNIMEGKRFFYPEDEERREEVYKAMGEKVWEDNNSLFFDINDEDFKVSKYTPRNSDYYGDGKKFVENWKKYMEAGVRRVVVLQGIPGTGKSTLCSYTSEKISKKTVSVSLGFIRACSDHEWFGLMSILNPDMLIIDDIDRMPQGILEGRLSIFEEGAYNVPLTIFTTNDDNKLPDAMRRPGRIDQIIEMPEPPRQGKIDMIKEFAKDTEIEGDIPEEKMDFLINVFEKTHSGAYVKEILRRCKVEGWEYELSDYDISFRAVSDGMREDL